MPEVFSMLQVADKLIDDYGISNGESDRSRIRNTVRNKLERVCKTISMRKNGVATNLADARSRIIEKKTIDEKSKQEIIKTTIRYEFTPEDIELMLDTPSLIEYISKNASTRGKAVLAKRMAREADAQNRDAILKEQEIRAAFFEALQSENDDPSCGYHISVNDLRAVKMEMMLEAIFLMYYKSFDEKLLEMDLWNVTFSETLSDDNNTLADIANARKRIEKRGYYEARPSRKKVKNFKKRQPKGASKRPSKPDKSK